MAAEPLDAPGEVLSLHSGVSVRPPRNAPPAAVPCPLPFMGQHPRPRMTGRRMGRVRFCHSLSSSHLQAGILPIPSQVDFSQMRKLRVMGLWKPGRDVMRKKVFPHLEGAWQGTSVGLKKCLLTSPRLQVPAAPHCLLEGPRKQVCEEP